MAAIPSVIIGLGTSGSEIVARVYHAFKRHCDLTGDNIQSIQFLMLDTDKPVKGAEELSAQKCHLMVGRPDGERLRKALWDSDPFFREWWFEDYVDIRRLYPGAGTVPIKGRLAFWSKLGDAHGADNFFVEFKDKFLRASNVQTTQDQTIVNVFLIGTLSGGTGSGTFMDVAQVIKGITGDKAILHSISVLPDVVHLRAKPDAHEQTAANGYAAMISMNYWLTPESKRPVQIGNFMERGNQVYTGDTPPIDVAWLISRVNAGARSFNNWEEYRVMIANVISMMSFEDQADNLQGRFNDFLDRLGDPDDSGILPQPKRFGSFATYSLRYHPESAVQYLGGRVAQRTVDQLLSSPGDLTDSVKPLVSLFMKEHRLRETDDDGDYENTNELLEDFQDYHQSDFPLYPPMEPIIDQLGVVGGATPLVMELDTSEVDEGNLEDAFRTFKRNVENGLYGELVEQRGVNYYETISANRRKKFKQTTMKSVEPDISLKTQVTGLYQQVEWLLGEKEFGIAKARRFLEVMITYLTANMNTLEMELKGDPKRGILGQHDELISHERALDGELAILEENMFGLFKKKRTAIQTFEENWWYPWLELLIDIRLKEEAVSFYLALITEIEFLLRMVEEQIPTVMKFVQREFEDGVVEVYQKRLGTNEARLEEEAVRDGETLENYFLDEVTAGVNQVKEKVAKQVGSGFYQYFAESEERSEDAQAKALRDLRAAVTEVFEGEAESRFGEQARSLSLWDVLKIDSKQTDAGAIRQAIETRVKSIYTRCSPFWQLSPGLLAFSTRKRSISMASYDQDVLNKFKAKENLDDISIAAAVEGSGHVEEVIGVSAAAYQASPYEFKVLNIEGGVPLAFIDGVNMHRPSFESWMDAGGAPCLRDSRLEEVLDIVGLPTWEISKDIEPVLSEETYQLLLAEQLGLWETPLVKRLRTAGGHRYDLHALGDSRAVAFEKLSSGGEHYEFARENIPPMLKALFNQNSQEKWEDLHIEAVARIQYVILNTPKSPAQALLRAHKKVMEEHINKEFGINPNEVAMRIKKEKLLNMFERQSQEQNK